jgi:hypothetical protein
MPRATPQLTEQNATRGIDTSAGQWRHDGQAQAEMNTIAAAGPDYPDTNKDITARVMTFNGVNGGPIKLSFFR